MHWRQEPPGAPRQVWCYEGSRVIEGEDCYVWKRYLAHPDPETGYRTMGCAHPVAAFWPQAS